MNRKQLFLVILIFLPLLLFANLNENSKKIMCVVIDAGHGGHDPGAVGPSKVYEKDITLSVALKLGGLIQKNHPEIKVIYTRKTDVFVELHKRADIANKNKADLFISIHCNSSKKSSPFGVETWVMGLHKSAANLEVAKKENGSILMEKDHNTKYDGFNPSSAEAYIIFSLFQNAYINQSLAFANSIQQNFKQNLKLYSRGVKQAGFLVLFKTSMPGVLTEIGFLSNSKDELYLKNENGPQSIAFSLYQSFVDYKSAIEGSNDKATSPTPLLTYDQIKDTSRVNKEEKSSTPIDVESLTDKFVANDKSTYKKKTTNENKVRNHVNTESLTKKFIDNDKSRNKIIDTTIKAKQSWNSTPEKTQNNSDPKKQNIIFRVQFYSSKVKKSDNSKEFQNLDHIFEYKQDNTFRYTAGAFSTLKDAVAYQSKMKSMGFDDSFVIAFNNNVRVSPTEANRLLSNQSNNQ